MMPCRLGTPPLTFSEDRRYANMLITFDTGLRTFSSTKSCPQAPSEELPFWVSVPWPFRVGA
jgi:hypothetical protein